MSDKEKFIAAIAPAAIASQRDTGVPASVTLAQAILESGWGEHAPGSNFFGVKAFGQVADGIRRAIANGTFVDSMCPQNMQVLWTTEYAGKQKYRIRDVFRRYETAADSFRDHGLFLRQHKRYAKAFDATADGREFARRIAAAGYATAPTYADSLVDLIDRYQLDLFDAEAAK